MFVENREKQTICFSEKENGMKRLNLAVILFAASCFFTLTGAVGVQAASSYEVVVADCTWSEAFFACIAKGGHLVTADSWEELVCSIFRYQGKWILNDEPDNVFSTAPEYSGIVGYVCEYEDAVYSAEKETISVLSMKRLQMKTDRMKYKSF